MKELSTIGIILDDESKQGLNHTYFSEILESFKLVLEKKNISILFLNNDRTRNEPKTYLEQLKEYGCVGCMIACIVDSEEITEILNSEIPVVAIDKNYENAINISSDNEKGMFALAEYIIELGHTKIAYIMGDDNEVSNIRLNGFLCACEKHHIKIPEEYIVRGKFRSMDKALYHTENFLKMETPPTCIIYSDDYASIGGINLLHARGLQAPKDISITGYDGNAMLQEFEPKLTTVRQDCEKMGILAAEKLIEVLNYPTINNNGNYVAETILFKGATVKKIYE